MYEIIFKIKTNIFGWLEYIFWFWAFKAREQIELMPEMELVLEKIKAKTNSRKFVT